MLQIRLFILFACTTLLASSLSWAQTYPNKPIRVIVPFGPGGPDALAHSLARKRARPLSSRTNPAPTAFWVQRRCKSRRPMATPS